MISAPALTKNGEEQLRPLGSSANNLWAVSETRANLVRPLLASRPVTVQADAKLLTIDLARTAIIKHFDDRIDKQYKLLFYLPFLNSESMGDQRLALFYIRERTKEDEWLDLAQQHYHTIQRFGRFPERSPILGRELTPEEAEQIQKDHPNKSGDRDLR